MLYDYTHNLLLQILVQGSSSETCKIFLNGYQKSIAQWQ